MIYNKLFHELGEWPADLRYQSFTVNPALTHLLQVHALLLGEEGCTSQQPWYILPDNSAHLVFCLFKTRNGFRTRLRLIGPRTRHIFINRSGRHLTFMTSFRPGALSLILGNSVHELVDHAVDASDCLDIDGSVLEQMKQFAVAGNAQAIKETIESVLLIQSLNSGCQLLPLVSEFLRHKYAGVYHVSRIAANIGVTERHLRNVVKKSIGHPPKLVLQIQRFAHSLELSNTTDDWSGIAYNSGYYDQSHMIADFQRMIGTSPERLFAS